MRAVIDYRTQRSAGMFEIYTEYFFPSTKTELGRIKKIIDMCYDRSMQKDFVSTLCLGISDKRMELLAERGALCEQYQAGKIPPAQAERRMKSVTNRLYKLTQNEGVVRKWQKDLQQ